MRGRFELEVQARFADARLGHRRDDLAVTRLRLLGRVLQHLHLALAPDEFRQPAPGRTLQASA